MIRTQRRRWDTMIRDLHAPPRRWCDARIAEELTDISGKFWSRRRVSRRRKAMDLPPNRRPYRNKYRRVQLLRRERPQIAELGWSVLREAHPDLRLIEARILTALHTQGPLTRHQLRDLLGHSLQTRRGKSWLASLQQRGLIRKQGQTRTIRLREAPHVYTLAPDVAPLSRTRRDNRIDRIA